MTRLASRKAMESHVPNLGVMFAERSQEQSKPNLEQLQLLMARGGGGSVMQFSKPTHADSHFQEGMSW
ncbi:hypothetical protein ACFX2I_039386 [Malus domestica]